MDRGTLDFYDANADAYAACSETDHGLQHLALFAADLPSGATVLDFGSGDGWAAGWLAAEGFDVLAFDGSEALLDLAAQRPGVRTELGTFDSFDAVEAYDGVWASFSLLHAPRADLSANIGRLAAALVPEGRLFVGLKRGQHEARDALGRFYAYFEPEEVIEALTENDLEVLSATSAEGKAMTGDTETFLYFHARSAD
ncbi:MAG: class I SAM-dependent methyltransferase [Pseudomonadota bacterium]